MNTSAITPNKEYTLELGDQKLTVKTGMLANQSNATVLCQMGDTVSMANVTISRKARDGVTFLPLQVVYQEKYYAGGVIGGGRFRKREGRPGDDYVLMSRLIDRGLRPMFPKHFHNDIQVFATVMSYDFEHAHDVTSANAANLAIALSESPVDGAIGSVRVGIIEGELILNPSVEVQKKSTLDLFISAGPGRIVMIEAGAKQVTEADMLRALDFGKKWASKIAEFFEGIQKELGKPKMDDGGKGYTHDEALAYMREYALADVKNIIVTPMAKLDRRAAFADLMDGAEAKLTEKYGALDDDAADDDFRHDLYKNAGDLMDSVIKGEVRRLILEDNTRMSGRQIDEIRPVEAMVDILPSRVHGSALFQRGETQGMTLTTLGSPGDKQLVEGMEGEKELRYMHHYNFPPFSVGETSNRLFVGNREIGHGNLAQRGLEPVLPTEEEFPYTIRTVTEILESNGSSSMAATCGSTLSLMAAGVPITAPVSGIAMGLMSDPATDQYIILSDLQDEEDFGGDMDFKVTGTAAGITAIQMDIKVKGLPDHVFVTALEKARIGRLHILDEMLKAISEPRSEMSPHAPRIETITINPDDIRVVIGKGGETIQKITKDLDVQIDIDDSGLVFVTAKGGEAMTKAKAWITMLVAKPEVGATYDGKVVRIIDGIGAIVEFLGGKDGMVHISELKWERTEKVEDVVNVGDEVQVQCVEYNAADGKTRLSIKQLLPKPEGYVERPARPSHGGGNRGPRR
jgi:polyribonucleotide nucleotidyltransferase